MGFFVVPTAIYWAIKYTGTLLKLGVAPPPIPAQYPVGLFHQVYVDIIDLSPAEYEAKYGRPKTVDPLIAHLYLDIEGFFIGNAWGSVQEAIGDTAAVLTAGVSAQQGLPLWAAVPRILGAKIAGSLPGPSNVIEATLSIASTLSQVLAAGTEADKAAIPVVKAWTGAVGNWAETYAHAQSVASGNVLALPSLISSVGAGIGSTTAAIAASVGFYNEQVKPLLPTTEGPGPPTITIPGGLGVLPPLPPVITAWKGPGSGVGRGRGGLGGLAGAPRGDRPSPPPADPLTILQELPERVEPLIKGMEAAARLGRAVGAGVGDIQTIIQLLKRGA